MSRALFAVAAILPTTVLVVTFFSGVQLLSLGMIGEYTGRIYEEVQRRPKYIIGKQVNAPATAEEQRQHWRSRAAS